MKRDMDLIRTLLLYFEQKQDFGVIKPEDVQVPGYDSRMIGYHIDLMCEANFLSCERVTSTTTSDRLIEAYPFRLTWHGHEFLDAARNDTLWKRAKKVLSDKGISATFAVLQASLVALAKHELGLQ